MAQSQWGAPAAETNIAGTALNGLIAGTTSLPMEFENGTGRIINARLRLVLGSITPAVGGTVVLRLVNWDAANSVWEDYSALSGHHESYAIALIPSVGAIKRAILPMVRIYPWRVGFVLTNSSGVNLAASGNGLFLSTFPEEMT
jgi:hypothetical protein